MYGSQYKFDKEEVIQMLEETTVKVKEEYKAGKRLEEKPRILVTGSPMGGVTEKVIRAIEENGGLVVAYENCTVAKAVERLVDENESDVYQALTDKYINIGCACMPNNQPRKELLSQMIDDYQVDGVIDMVLQNCIPFSVESLKIKRFLNEEKNIPYMYLETYPIHLYWLYAPVGKFPKKQAVHIRQLFVDKASRSSLYIYYLLHNNLHKPPQAANYILLSFDSNPH